MKLGSSYKNLRQLEEKETSLRGSYCKVGKIRAQGKITMKVCLIKTPGLV